MRRNHRLFLLTAGICSSIIAVIHLLILIIGQNAYRYFKGLGDLFADALLQGKIWPIIVTSIIAAIFILFAIFAFSGAKIIPTIPLLRTGLLSIGMIYIIRGLINFPFYWKAIIIDPIFIETQSVVYDTISITIGLCYLLGTIINWKNIGEKKSYAPDKRFEPTWPSA